MSTSTSVFRASLQLSAELTGLIIDIPDQPIWTDSDINHLKSSRNSSLKHGAAKAWLGHLNALRWYAYNPFPERKADNVRFVAQNVESALIIEDDVDWDLRLRTHQIPLAARAMRRAHPSPSSRSFWPPPSATTWDLLWLGHCGDYFRPPRLSSVAHEVYSDPTVPAQRALQVDTQRFMRPLLSSSVVTPGHRVLHRSIRPLCSFGYAISRTAARRALAGLWSREDLADLPPSAQTPAISSAVARKASAARARGETGGGGGTQAFDVRLLESCRDLGTRCWTVNPELLHHSDDTRSQVRAASGEAQRPIDWQAEMARARGAPNVGCGVRKIVDNAAALSRRRGGAGATEQGRRRAAAVARMVALAAELGDVCPVSVGELEEMRSVILVDPRKDLHMLD